MQKACLILSDGSVFEGIRFGAARDAVCEVVFNTGLTGYVELLTDASYAGQAITMASPIIGNYGVFENTSESTRPWVEAFILRDLTTVEGDQRQAENLETYLKRNDIPGIYGIDTRALTLLIREHGTMLGLLTDGTKEDVDMKAAIEKIAKYDGSKLVPMVSRRDVAVFPAGQKGWDRNKYVTDAASGKPTALVPAETPPDAAAAKKPAYRIALIDFGVKQNIIWNLVDRDCEVIAFPWDSTAKEILAVQPDGILLSNGPGDPKNCGPAIKQIAQLYASGTPIMGICLGHQLMALATGADTHKLRYGHRGINHPVKDLRADRVYITSQNHGYVVTDETLSPEICEISHLNMNDGSIEGLRYLNKPVFTVQYHPEGAPGPLDNNYLFDEFLTLIDDTKKKAKEAL
ncbi:MAG: carbamoyl phosphate synthase small subunit [Eubacteriales bacterium]